ncbi:putative dipeptidyl-aminopeptidase B [Geopyxis carbonaria]|nr:putative dipeptidyl-aminopeptidase B [Geopyxis carbonaria]
MSSQSPYHDEVGDSFSPPGDESTRSSIESTSTTSLILERIHPGERVNIPYDDPEARNKEAESSDDEDDYDADVELGRMQKLKPMEKKVRRAVYIIGALLIGGWLLSLVVYLSRESYRVQDIPHDPSATATVKAGKKLLLDHVMSGQFRATKRSVQWLDGEQDGLMLVSGGTEGFLEIHNIKNETDVKVLMKKSQVDDRGQVVSVQKYWPSPDLKHVLVATDLQSVWRHSYTARYFVLDVATQEAQPLIPRSPEKRIALATWSPSSDAVAFVLENNLYIRQLSEKVTTTAVTQDGGTSLFYGIPDWVYEEEVFAGNSALWWSGDGQYIAFLRTNETEVPDYPLQYFVSRPSGKEPKEGLENYPELDFIKYPKAGAPNPVVHLQFFDIEKEEAFSVNIEGDLADDNRLITEVVWAGGGQVLIRETNRESDLLKMVLIDVNKRQGKVVREVDVAALDGGWFEVTQNTKYIPADEAKGRKHDGYIDEIVLDGYNHLAYFTPLDNDKPVHLTKGKWEVVDAPSAVDLANNLVYFIATKKSSIERHVYSVKLDGTGMADFTNTTDESYYGISFSTGAGYALLDYDGPGIPYQKMIGTPAVDKSFSKVWQENQDVERMAREIELPTFHYSTVNIDGVDLNVVERRPPHFDSKKTYPVLFYVYGGPGSQLVDKRFDIDYQSFIAANLEYIVVTVDGRGTGYIGREARCIVRGNLGYWEAHDQIETAKIWGAKAYVDESRIAIWGWSYGGFMTLKTLEQDAGKTFSYGMAVAPVTDWRFYDSIYTERYMHTPQHNLDGYQNATIDNVTAVGENVRFLLMHGVADDNVHVQNSLTLLDKFDLAGIENYDFHAFPDSDHSIYFHNAKRMVYDRLEQWLIRAFNGEYLKLADLRPIKESAVDS